MEQFLYREINIIISSAIIIEELTILSLCTNSHGESMNTTMLCALLKAVYIYCATAKCYNIPIKSSLIHVNIYVRKKKQYKNNCFSVWFCFNDIKEFLFHCSTCLSSCPLDSETIGLWEQQWKNMTNQNKSNYAIVTLLAWKANIHTCMKIEYTYTFNICMIE